MNKNVLVITLIKSFKEKHFNLSVCDEILNTNDIKKLKTKLNFKLSMQKLSNDGRFIAKFKQK